MPAIRGRNPEAYRAGFRTGEMMAVDVDGLDQLLSLGAQALGDVLNDDSAQPARWRAGEFLLGMTRGYATKRGYESGGNAADEATTTVL